MTNNPTPFIRLLDGLRIVQSPDESRAGWCLVTTPAEWDTISVSWPGGVRHYRLNADGSIEESEADDE